MGIIHVGLIQRVERFLAKRSGKKYISYLKKYYKIKIGVGTVIFDPKTFDIDVSRPSLITIGDNVFFNKYVTIVCHDIAAKSFRESKGELLPSNGHVIIGNNVSFGRFVMVLKGVEIGDNCIIGANSVVTKDIPANSVAIGSPAKVICTLDEYYKKRQERALEESFEYARSIKERFNRRPVPEDFFESFVYFVNGDEVDKYPQIPIKYQLGPCYNRWIKNHKAKYNSFDEFLKAAGIN